MLTKADILVVRACKLARNPRKRLHSIRRRMYLNNAGDIESVHVALLLTRLLKYVHLGIEQVITDLSPDHHGIMQACLKTDEPYDYWEAVITICIGRIMCSPVNNFPGFKMPTSVRNKS